MGTSSRSRGLFLSSFRRWILLCLSAIFFLFPSFFFYLRILCVSSFLEKKLYLFKISSLATLSYFYCSYFDLPSFPDHHILKGEGILTLTEKRYSTFFGKTSLYYKGVFLIFQTDDFKTFYNIPCSFILKPSQEIAANQSLYLSHVELIHKTNKQFQLKFSKDSKIKGAKNNHSLTQWRFKQKMKMEQHLNRAIKDPKVLKFLQAMTLGYLDHKTLTYEFSKTGIQHLLTISGFHFALLALALSWILKPLLPRPLFYLTLIFLLASYVLYLGPSPSVSRSWIVILLYLLANYFEIPSSGLNNLGIACLLAFLDNPLCLMHIGFQLSYLATFGIICYYQLCDRWLEIILPKRNLSELASFPLHLQLLCYLLSLLRKALALDSAVNLITIPLIFYHFGNFPLFSFFYNLLIPFLVTGTLFLLMLAITFAFIPPISTSIHHINEAYTKQILNLVSSSPKDLEGSIYLNLSTLATLFSLLIIFLTLIYLNKKQPPLIV